jgi:hypothetical protein
MNKARIKEEAEHFFEWPDPKRRDHVTLASCLIFAEVIAGMAVDAEREACAKVCDQRKLVTPEWVLDQHYNQATAHCAAAIRERGMK